MASKNKVESLKTLITPDGIAAFPSLREPDTKYKPGFRIRVYFDKADPQVKKFFRLLTELNFKYLKDLGKLSARSKKKPQPKCIKIADEKAAKLVGVKIGTPYIEFSTNYKEGDDPIVVFDAAGNKTNKRVFGTDLVAIDTTVGGWQTPTGEGVKCYLNGVQLLQSNWSGGRANAGKNFVARDEYVIDDDDETIDEPDEAGLEEEDVDIDIEDDDPADDDDLDLGEDDDPSGNMV